VPAVHDHHALLHGGKDDLQVRLGELSLPAEMLILRRKVLGALSETGEGTSDHEVGGLAAVRQIFEDVLQPGGLLSQSPLTRHPRQDGGEQENAKEPSHAKCAADQLISTMR
jgi:hypothetical protein